MVIKSDNDPGLGAGDRIEALTRKLLMTIKEDFVSCLGPKMW